MENTLEAIYSIFDRMENKLIDIKNKNMEKVEDKEKLEQAIQEALEVVKRAREEKGAEIEELVKKLEDGEISKEEFVEKVDEIIKDVLEQAKQYLGKDRTGLRTAKATFSRCVNVHKKKVFQKILEQ